LSVAAGTTLTLSGGISGTGRIAKQGPGILELSGPGTWTNTGSLQISAGGLIISHADAFPDGIIINAATGTS
jgi:autotransporter-associated beta strand protein